MSVPTSIPAGATYVRDLLILQETLERCDPTLRSRWVDIIKEKLIFFSASTGLSIERLVEFMDDAMKAIAATIIITPVV